MLSAWSSQAQGGGGLFEIRLSPRPRVHASCELAVVVSVGRGECGQTAPGQLYRKGSALPLAVSFETWDQFCPVGSVVTSSGSVISYFSSKR